MGLLMRWGSPESVCRMIAMAACGNVGLAMNELEEWLMTNPKRTTHKPVVKRAVNLEIAMPTLEVTCA